MEFALIASTEFQKEVSFNKEELLAEVENRLAKYDNLVYDDYTQIKDAKIDRAALNAFKAALGGKRKEIKKKCLEIYEGLRQTYKCKRLNT